MSNLVISDLKSDNISLVKENVLHAITGGSVTVLTCDPKAIVRFPDGTEVLLCK